MTKLNQIVALVTGRKKAATAAATAAYHAIQKPELLAGISKVYRPKDEEGEQLPPESKLVQIRIPKLLSELFTVLAPTWDTVATQDVANTSAIVQIKPEFPQVPVTYLLYLEKQLTDIMTFVEKIPVLDPTEEWTYDQDRECYTTSSETTRTKKISKPMVLAEATDKHPAQVKEVSEDVLVGFWKTTKLSGAIPASKRALLLANCTKLKEAVIVAREKANNFEVTDTKIGDAIVAEIMKGFST